ncbi:MAG: hypothetical protein K9I94_10545 [Bacteroidales bacterium]|nr:hypothetical protein [Bacteroidales bacterium]
METINTTAQAQAKIFKGGSFLSPETIEINGNYLTYRRKYNFCTQTYSITFPLLNIVSVDLNTGLNGVNIVIESYAKSHIIARGFSQQKANTIKELVFK